MRYSPEHTEKLRAALLEAGVEQMKIHGFNGIGVDGIASAAGVTSGAVYSNFTNKAGLLTAIVETYLGQFSAAPDAPDAPRDDVDGLKDFLAYYIGDTHSLDAQTGCIMPALSEDVARNPAAQVAYDRQATVFATRIAQALGGEPEQAQRRAWSLVALMVGAVTVSRAMVPGSSSQQQALHAGLAAAIAIVDGDASPSM